MLRRDNFVFGIRQQLAMKKLTDSFDQAANSQSKFWNVPFFPQFVFMSVII
jgi:hypothetical protein